MSGFRRLLFTILFIGFSTILPITLFCNDEKNEIFGCTNTDDMYGTFEYEEDGVFSKAFARKMRAEATVDFFAVDLKYDHGKIKVLEFQDGPQAGLRAYDEVFEKGGIWKKFWDWLSQFHLPIWYVGIMPKEVVDGQFSHYDKDRIAFDYFLKKIGWYSRSLAALERDRTFRKFLQKGGKQKGPFAGHKGIILLKDQMSRNMVHQFKKKYPEFIIVNQHSRFHVNSKATSDSLFQDDFLKEFRPYAKRLHKEYLSRMARDIIDEFKSDYYLIKPLNSSRSNGVIMASKEDLDAVLKKVLVEKRNNNKHGHGSYRPAKPLTYDYWLGDRNNAFLIEKYEPSQIISVNGQLYDPTMRAMCVIYSYKGRIHVEVLEAFWKVPPKPLSSTGDLTEMHVSKHRPDLAQLSKEDLTVSPEDMDTLRNNLALILSKVYVKMLIS